MAWLHPVYLASAAAVLGLIAWRASGRARGASLIASALALILSGLLGVPYVWPRPSPTTQTLYSGVVYERLVRDSPRPLVLHVLRVALDAPGLRFEVTPPELPPPRTHRARTTSTRLAEARGQVAINGSFFSPFHSSTPWDYAPHAGDPVEVWGLGLADGARFGAAEPGAASLVFGDETRIVDAWEPEPRDREALSGQRLPRAEPADALPQPRTAVGIDHDAHALLLVVVDGRQPTYSEGVTLSELWELLTELGADAGIALDGGGSSTMVDAERGVLSRPIHTRVVGRERPVANHLVVFAPPRASD